MWEGPYANGPEAVAHVLMYFEPLSAAQALSINPVLHATANAFMHERGENKRNKDNANIQCKLGL